MIDIVAPTEQEGTKAVVKSWLKKRGDAVRKDEPVVEIETDKVAVEIAAVADGVLAEVLAQEGADVEPGAILGRIAEGAARPPEFAPLQSAALAAPDAPQARPTSTAPPGIRRLLEQHGLAADEVPKSAERLTREDIEAEVARRAAGSANVKFQPHDSMRRRIAENLSRSLAVAPHVTAVFEADFGAVAAHRAAHKEAFAGKGANLTYTPYFVAASVAAMRAVPAVNARWFDDRIELYDDVNIGVGVALGDRGLIVPVVHRAQTLSLLEIATQLTELTARARDGKLSQNDVRGGTFTISNHGVSGSLLAAPIIINQPQSAILGVGKLEKRAVVRNDEIVIRPMAYVTLTIDHRVIDAFQTNAWLTRFVESLENFPAAA